MPVLNFVSLLFLRSWYRARMQAAQNQTKPKLPKNSGYLASEGFFCFVFYSILLAYFFLTSYFCYSLALEAKE